MKLGLDKAILTNGYHLNNDILFITFTGIGVLQPVFQITDPYLNLFRGLIPPVFGLDLSPILAFVLLNVLTNVTAAVGAEVTPSIRKKLQQSSSFTIRPYYKDEK